MSAGDWQPVSVYHFTTPQAADAIVRTRTWVSAENTGEVYASNRVDGQATGYGQACVRVLIPRALLTVDDEFPDGEEHYRFDPKDALIIGRVI